MENENNLQNSSMAESSKVKKSSIKNFFKSKTVIACIIVGITCFALGFGTSRLTMRGRFRGMMNRPGYSRNRNGNFNGGNMQRGTNGGNTQTPGNGSSGSGNGGI